MKRSEINAAIRAARSVFDEAGWALPPNPRWDVTDFGLGQFQKKGLVLVNLAEEQEYCEKVMFAVRGQRTVAHCHRRKKEDIIVRRGTLRIQLWRDKPERSFGTEVSVGINGESRTIPSGTILELSSGERVTIRPGIYHEFWPDSDTCVIGEVSTLNDDVNDNFFVDPEIGRFPTIDEDEPPLVRLAGETSA
jgi:hypothetical protein